MIARMRDELKRAADEVAQQANAELEQHAAERRHALHDVADRLRQRERDLQELVEREGNDAAQRIQLALGDIERRHVEQLQRTVSRETTRYAEAAALSFDSSIKSAREEAARRLSRELDLSVERFAREAEGVLTDRLNALTEAAAGRVEERLSRLRSALERQRDEALVSLEDRAHQVEIGPRETVCARSRPTRSPSALCSTAASTSSAAASTSSRRERKDSVSHSNFRAGGFV